MHSSLYTYIDIYIHIFIGNISYNHEKPLILIEKLPLYFYITRGHQHFTV
jgi:hypothetical protein